MIPWLCLVRGAELVSPFPRPYWKSRPSAFTTVWLTTPPSALKFAHACARAFSPRTRAAPDAPADVALIYGEYLPLPLGEGLPMEGVQRPIGSAATLPSIAAAARVGRVFQREIYDGPLAEGEAAHRVQTVFQPGLADSVERGLSEPVRIRLE